MDVPIYCVVDTFPVKVVGTDDGALEVLAYDPVTGEFVRRMDLLERVLMQDDWVVELTEEEFEAHLSNLREEFIRRTA
jgi:hypothetical protein